MSLVLCLLSLIVLRIRQDMLHIDRGFSGTGVTRIPTASHIIYPGTENFLSWSISEKSGEEGIPGVFFESLCSMGNHGGI